MCIRDRNRLHVPAVSIAIVHGGKIEWAKGYGIMREGDVYKRQLCASVLRPGNVGAAVGAVALLRRLVKVTKRLAMELPVNSVRIVPVPGRKAYSDFQLFLLMAGRSTQTT